MAVVNHLAVMSQFAQRSLKSDPVGPQILQQTLPPVRAFVDDLVSFCFGDAIAPARLDEHLTPDTTVAKSLGYSFSQFLTFAGSALIDCNDLHDNLPPYHFSKACFYLVDGGSDRTSTQIRSSGVTIL